MLTLYSYPELFGVADNNGYGLKVFALMRLVGLPFVHEHLFDASAAPRGQLPYIVDDGETGFVVPMGDVATLADALMRLREDGTLRERLGARGAQRMREHFSTQRMVEDVERLYAKILER